MIEDIRWIQRLEPIKTGEKTVVKTGNVTSIQDEKCDMLSSILQIKINGEWRDVKRAEETMTDKATMPHDPDCDVIKWGIGYSCSCGPDTLSAYNALMKGR